MLDLSAIKFQVDTSELERAQKTIADLAQDFTKIDKASQQAARTQAQTDAILARANKDMAKARLENSKAADQELKSAIAADKADQAREKTIKKTSDATEKQTSATQKSVSILERQRDILEFQTQGYSKGQSSVLAYGKAAGLAATELQELSKILDTQRKLMGNDPFDKSLSGIKSLQNQYTELRESLRQYNAGSELTSKQTKELARDKERLIERMKVEGASFQDIRQAVRGYNQEYVNLANQYNKLASAEDGVIKQRREMVSATNYVTQADQKMAAALSTSNAAIDKAGTDSLVKYENALRKSGLAQDVVTDKLTRYKTQLAQVQAAEEARKTNNLTRAISPQITDIAVSLYSGQAPLTVLLQQGGQLADIFRLSGVEAGNLGKLMKESFYSMIPVIKEVGAALGGLVVGMVTDLGKGVVRTVSDLTGMTAAMNKLKQVIVAGGEENFKYIAGLNKMATALASVATGGIVALITLLIALGLEYKKIIAAERELSVALATSGGAMGLSKDQAVQYAEGMQSLGVGTLKAMDAITEFAKAGKIGAEGLDELVKAAIGFEKYAGVAISETAKEYSKLQDEPTKALVGIAEKTGLVDKATLDLVASLEQQGNKAEAARVATGAYTEALNASTSEIKANLSPVEQLWDNIRGAIGKVKQEIYDLSTSNAVIDVMKTIWQTISVIVSETWFTLKGVGKEIGGIAAQIGAVMRGDFAGAKAIGDSMKVDAAAARAEQEKLVNEILGRGQVEKQQHQERKQENSEYAAWRKDNEKALEKQYSKDERFAQKKIQLQNDLKAGIIDEIKLNEALAGWKRIIYGDKKPTIDKQPIKDLETQVDLWNKSIGLTTTYNNEYQALVRQLERGKISQEEFNSLFDALLAKQPAMLQAKKEENDAHELSNKLLGKADGFGKDYYTTLEKIAEFTKKGLYSPEQAKALEQAAFNQTELAKSQLKYIQDSTNAYEKYAANSQKSLDSSTLENQKLDDRVALLGLTSDQQKFIRIEQERQAKLLKVQLDYEREIAKINNDERLDPWDKERAKLEAARARAEEEKVINREVAVAYAEDLDRELRNIKEGISDSIVTAMFEGGKAGSQKLRSVLVEALKRPVTVVVNAVVNTLLGSVLGSLGGKDGGGILGALSGGNNIFSAISGGLNIAGIGGKSLINNFANILSEMGMEVASEMVGQFGAGMMNTSSMGGFMASMKAGGANMAGAIAGSIMNGFAGYSISKLISGGYQLNKYIDKIAGVASMIPGIGPIAGVIGGVINRLFGRKLKESGVEGTFGGESGFEGRTYQYYKGGLFRSSKTKYGELDEETRSGFADSFTDLKKSVGEMASTLGLGSEALKDFTYSFKINLMGMSEEEATKALAEQFTAMSNSMAELILTTDEYSKADESRIDTLSRLATSLMGVNTIFENMGLSMLEASLKGADAASELVDAFGDLNTFTSVLANYYDKFYTDSEKQILLQTQLDKAFKDLNVSTPKTRDEFRALVNSQDLMSESGRKTFLELMKLVDGFDQLLASAEALNEEIANSRFDLTQRTLLAEADVYEAQGNPGMAAQQRRAALDLRRKQEYDALYKLDPELAKLVAHVYELEDAAGKASDETKRLEEETKKLEEAARKLADIESKRFDLTQRLLIAEGKNRQALDLRRKQEYDALWKLNPELADMAANIWRLEDAAEARNKGYSALEKAVAAEKKLLAERIQVAEQSISALSSFFDTLKGAVDSLYNQVNSTSALSYVAARQLVSSAYNTAKVGGRVTPNQALTEAVGISVSGLTSDSFRNKSDFDIEKLRLAAQLAVLQNSTKASLTTEERILEQLKSQDANLDKTLEYWKRQLDIANGTYEATLSVTDAIYNLANALGVSAEMPTNPNSPGSAGGTPGSNGSGGATFGGGGGSSGTGYKFIDDDGRIHYNDGTVGPAREGWQNAQGTWVWSKNSEFYKRNPDKIPAFANGGNYSGGMALVGEQGPELINFGNPGFVHTAKQTSNILSGSDSRISALEASSKRQEALLASIAENTKRSSDTLRNVTRGGDSIVTTLEEA